MRTTDPTWTKLFLQGWLEPMGSLAAAASTALGGGLSGGRWRRLPSLGTDQHHPCCSLALAAFPPRLGPRARRC